MFNFQKEVVLNSLAKAAVVENKDVTGFKKVRFHDGGEYFGKYIVGATVYKTKPVVGQNFELTLNVTDLVGKHVSVLIELGLDNDYRGDYGSALFYFRKPLLVDLVLPETASDAAEVLKTALVAAVPAEYKFVTVEDPEGSKVTVKGVDSYQKVRKVAIVEYVCDSRCAGDSEEPSTVTELSNGALVEGNDYVEYVPNSTEFGTADYLLHNLRLPTYANMRFTSPMQSEMPVAGTNYIQYTFAYCVPRVGFGGMSVVGQSNHSTTLHTFFVPEALEGDFEGLFGELDEEVSFEEITRGEKHNITILPDKYAATKDLGGKKVTVSTSGSSLSEEIAELNAKA